MSNTQLETFYVPKSNSSWLWGVGPYLASPAGSSGRFGSNQTGAGASAIVLNRQEISFMDCLHFNHGVLVVALNMVRRITFMLNHSLTM
jgi:hypothetical protein